jgi:hypothetical protein
MKKQKTSERWKEKVIASKILCLGLFRIYGRFGGQS